MGKAGNHCWTKKEYQGYHAYNSKRDGSRDVGKSMQAMSSQHSSFLWLLLGISEKVLKTVFYGLSRIYVLQFSGYTLILCNSWE